MGYFVNIIYLIKREKRARERKGKNVEGKQFFKYSGKQRYVIMN